MRGTVLRAALQPQQLPDDGQCDRVPIVGAGAAAKLIHDDQRVFGRLVENSLRLLELDEESGFVLQDAVTGANAREYPIDD